MLTTEEKIAELVRTLPMYIGFLLDGIEIKYPIKLNVSEAKTLLFLHKREGNPMSEYSKKVGLTKIFFRAGADRLEKKELIKKLAVSDDRRKNALILTEKGKAAAQKIDSLFNLHISHKIPRLNDEELTNIKNAVEKTIAIIEKIK